MKRSLWHGVVGLLSVGLTAGLAFGGNHHQAPPAPAPQPVRHEAPPASHQHVPQPVMHEAPPAPHEHVPAHIAPPSVTHRPTTHPGQVPSRPKHRVAPGGKKLKVRPGAQHSVKPTHPSAQPGHKPGLTKPGHPGKPKLTPTIKNTLHGMGPKVRPKTNLALQHVLLGVVLTIDEIQYLKGAAQDLTNGLTDDERWAICTAVDACSPTTSDDTETTDQGASEYGLEITRLVDDGAASAAGLKAGDVILSVAGVRVQTGDDLEVALANAGGDLEVVYIDGDSGETLSVDATPQDGVLGVYVESVELDAE